MSKENLEQMTKEELLKEIEKLKEEIIDLKNTKNTVRDSSRNLLPEKLLKKYNGTRHPHYYNNADLPFIYYQDIVTISQTIRDVCFPKELKPSCKRHPNRVSNIKSTKSMNEEEYEHYTAILDDILSIFMNNARKDQTCGE